MVVQLDRPQVLAPQHQPKTLPGRVTFTGTDPKAPADAPKVNNGPETDVFQPAADKPDSPAAQAAGRLADFLKTDEDRKANAAAFFQLVTEKLPYRAATPAIEEQKRAELKALAESVRQMTPLQKVELMQKLTGPESPYSKVAETILVNQQLPNMRDVANLFKPQVQQRNFDGIAAAIQGIGLGLLLLPVLCPASILFRPELLGQFAAGLAVILI